MVYIQDLMANQTVTEEHRAILGKSMAAYQFPVQSMVMRPDTGEILRVLNANEMMDFQEDESAQHTTDPLAIVYNNFLMEGIRLAREEKSLPNPDSPNAP